MLLPPPTAPQLRGSFTRPYRRASHADQCSNVRRSRADCWYLGRILERWDIWTECLDVDEPYANDYAGNTHALFDTVDGYSVQIEFPASANIAAQSKAVPVSDERACFFDSTTDGRHVSALTVKPMLIHQEIVSQKLHIDFSAKSSICRCMAKLADDEIRKLFTEIGCIMEDASLVALMWRDADGIDLRARLQGLSDAHMEIGNLLARIDRTG